MRFLRFRLHTACYVSNVRYLLLDVAMSPGNTLVLRKWGFLWSWFPLVRFPKFLMEPWDFP